MCSSVSCVLACSPSLSLLRTRVVRASLSTSSLTINSPFLIWFAISRAGMRDCTEEIFFSLNRIRQSWNSHFAPKQQYTLKYTATIIN